MRVGMVCYPTYGGSGVVAAELGQALAARGHEVHFITYRQPARLGALRENIAYHEVCVSNYPLFDFPPYELALSGVIADVAASHRLDLVHVHYAIPHATAARAARDVVEADGGRLPIVTTLHGTDITIVGQDRYLMPVVSRAICASDAVTAVSESLRQETLDKFRVDCNIGVITNFVDLSRYRREAEPMQRRHYARDEERVLVHVSNFRPVKRVGDVVRMFARVREQLPARLLLVGDGPERSNVEALARDLGVAGSVTFCGQLRSPSRVLTLGDLFVLPSENESFGLAALEAMACGLPVISTNTGGLPELNVDGETGFAVPVGAVDEMARRAVEILRDPATLSRFSDGAYARACLFRVDDVVPRYEALYERVLERRA